MARKPKDPNGEIVRAISIVLTDTQLKNLDTNVQKMKNYLIGRGIPEQKVNGLVNRSAIIREMVLELATERGYLAMLSGFATALGLDASQTELFEKQFEKEDNTIHG
jgi:hypothetical protein